MDVRWWIGILESTEDPDNLGRVRIRIPGIHTDYTGDDRLDEGFGIKTEQLPFCIVSTPLIYSGTIPPPQCQVGNWILGISLDGDNYQKLIALGIIRGEYCAEALGDGTSANPDQMEEPQPIQNQCYDKYYSALDSISTSGSTESNKSALQDGGVRFKDAMSEMKSSNPDQYSKVSQASGLDVNTSTSNVEVANNADANRIYGRTMFDQMMSSMGENPVMAALAFKVGVDKATQLRDTYSGQSKTYEEFIKNLKSSGNENEAQYIENFINAVGDGFCLGASGALSGNVMFISTVTGKEIKVSEEVKNAIVNAAQKTGLDSNLLATIANLESSLNPNDATGSHIGLFQINNDLKNEMIKHYGSQLGLSASDNLRDPVKNSLYGAAHLMYNKNILSKKGIPFTPTNIYITHQLGQGGGPGYLSMALSNPNASCTTAIGKYGLKREFFTSNSPFYYTDKSCTKPLTFSQSLQAFENRMTKVGIQVKSKEENNDSKSST